MAQNFVSCDRDQELLLPPSLREWLPEDHLAWFVIDAVAALDLAAFCAVYREDGHGRAAHEPSMMVALLLYAYAIGRRGGSSGAGPLAISRRTGPATSVATSPPESLADDDASRCHVSSRPTPSVRSVGHGCTGYARPFMPLVEVRQRILCKVRQCKV